MQEPKRAENQPKYTKSRSSYYPLPSRLKNEVYDEKTSLKTKLLSPSGQPVSTPLVIQTAEAWNNHLTGENRYHVRIGVRAPLDEIRFVGTLTYRLEVNDLVIENMKNESAGVFANVNIKPDAFFEDPEPPQVTYSEAYKHVGAALLEYAFRMSLAHGKNGKVKLNSTSKAFFFYLACGFIPENFCVLGAAPIGPENNRYHRLLQECQQQLKKKRRIEETEHSGMMYLTDDVIRAKTESFFSTPDDSKSTSSSLEVSSPEQQPQPIAPSASSAEATPEQIQQLHEQLPPSDDGDRRDLPIPDGTSTGPASSSSKISLPESSTTLPEEAKDPATPKQIQRPPAHELPDGNKKEPTLTLETVPFSYQKLLQDHLSPVKPGLLTRTLSTQREFVAQKTSSDINTKTPAPQKTDRTQENESQTAPSNTNAKVLLCLLVTISLTSIGSILLGAFGSLPSEFSTYALRGGSAGLLLTAFIGVMAYCKRLSFSSPFSSSTTDSYPTDGLNLVSRKRSSRRRSLKGIIPAESIPSYTSSLNATLTFVPPPSPLRPARKGARVDDKAKKTSCFEYFFGSEKAHIDINEARNETHDPPNESPSDEGTSTAPRSITTETEAEKDTSTAPRSIAIDSSLDNSSSHTAPLGFYLSQQQ